MSGYYTDPNSLSVSPEVGYINIREGVIVLYFVNVWRSVTSDYFVVCLYFTVSVSVFYCKCVCRLDSTLHRPSRKVMDM